MNGRMSLGHALSYALVAAGTTWAALMAWRGFLTNSGDYLAPLAVTAVVIAAGGALLRWLGSPALLTVAAQVLLAVAMVSSELGGGLLPFGDTGDAIRRSVELAMESAQTYEAPIRAGVPSIAPLLLLGGVLFVLIVDFLACTLRRVPVAGLALLAIYSVPAGLVQSGPGLVAFLLASSGFLVLLHMDNRDHLLKWGRPLGSEERNPWTDANPVVDAVRVGAGRIGVAATACAVLLPPFVPVLDLELLGLGPGDGDDNITIRNPRTDLRQDLERGEDVPLLRIHTDDPDPTYLRVAVLHRFTGEEWSSGDRSADYTTPIDAIPPAPGLSPDVPRRGYHYDYEATDDFESYWLPAPFPANAIDAPEGWGYDEGSTDLISIPDDLSTEDLTWSADGDVLDYGTDGEFFKNSALDAVDDELLDIPSGLPTIVRSQAFAQTSGAVNDYEAALLLQSYFRERGGFEYELEEAPVGIGGNAFETFLDADAPRGRVGYCEQFASAMAVMARMVGIPSRVAVGFLKPDPLGNGDFEYSSHDLHAWPELYFDGAGWVRFEPTPSDRAATAPAYSTVPVDVTEPTDITNDPTSQEPSRGNTETVTAPPTTAAPEEESTDAGTSQDEGVDWVVVLLRVAVVVLVLALIGAALLIPRLVRRRRRARRLAGPAEDLWDELRATTVDLALPWPPGRSPQEVGRVLVDLLGDRSDSDRPERPRTGPDADPEAAAALERLVAALEVARYARPGSVVHQPGLAEDAQTCCASLAAGVTRRVALRARWWPRSAFQRTPREPVAHDDDLVKV